MNPAPVDYRVIQWTKGLIKIKPHGFGGYWQQRLEAANVRDFCELIFYGITDILLSDNVRLERIIAVRINGRIEREECLMQF